jgi:hypothetical protein
MKTKNLIVAATIVGSAFIVQQASAAFTLMDNLTTEATGNLTGDNAALNGGSGTWTGLGTAGAVIISNSVTTGKAAITAPGGLDGGDYLALPTAIAVGNTATVFFQFDLGSSIAADNVSWSVENIGTATDAQGGSAVDVADINANAPNRTGLTGRNGGTGFQQLFGTSGADNGINFVPVANTMYSAWFVVNNSSQTYSIYLAGGSLGSTAVLMDFNSAGGASSVGLRNASAATISDFVFGEGGTGDTTTQGLYDVYEDASGLDTVNPVPSPEPTTLALMGLGGAALMLVRRNRKA